MSNFYIVSSSNSLIEHTKHLYDKHMFIATLLNRARREND